MTDRQTDGRTDVQPISITCFSIADARKNGWKASLVLHTHELKVDNEKTLKQNVERHVVREGSPVGVQWVVRWVGDGLWWEGFVE